MEEILVEKLIIINNASSKKLKQDELRYEEIFMNKKDQEWGDEYIYPSHHKL